jgi:hypothetical protein
MGLLGYRAPSHGVDYYLVLDLGGRVEECLGGIYEALGWKWEEGACYDG